MKVKDLKGILENLDDEMDIFLPLNVKGGFILAQKVDIKELNKKKIVFLDWHGDRNMPE